MKVKVADLIGRPLAWALLRYGGAQVANPGRFSLGSIGWAHWHIGRRNYLYSGQEGDPIITLLFVHGMWEARTDAIPETSEQCMRGPTPLVAGLRCYVGYKAGEEIDVPERML